jgi:hypothetical protein
MHNTRNGELPGHHLKEDYGLPEGPHASDLINRDSGVPIVQEHVQLRMDDLASSLYDTEYNSIPTDMAEPVNEERAELANKFSSDPQSEKKVEAAALAQKEDKEAVALAKEIQQEASERATAQNALNERSSSDFDTEYIQLRFSDYVNTIQGPEDLELLQTDADGDGIEDDKFYKPAVFGMSEDIYNTRHGGLPGHRQAEFFDNQSEPKMNPTTLIKSDYWNKLGVTPGGSEVPEGEPHAC